MERGRVGKGARNDEPIAFDQEASGSYLADMTTVGLKILKNKLSEYVRRAASGETVLVTDRGRIVADLVPHKEEIGFTPFQAKGLREGWLKPARRPFPPLPPGKPVSGLTLEKLLEDLAGDREDRW